MNLLFVHDHKFKTSDYCDFYSAGTFPSFIWKRYLSSFNNITVLAREDSNNPYLPSKLSNYSLSSHENVNFILQRSASSIKSLLGFDKNLDRELTSIIKNHDALIVRLHSELGLKAIKIAQDLRKPYAIELVECPWDSMWNYGGLKSKLYAPLCFFRTRYALKKSPFSLYVTKHFLQHRYPSKSLMSVDCSNVEIPFVSTNVLENRIKKIELLDVDRPIVLGQIASLTGNFKGVDTAIKSLSHLKKKNLNVSLRVLGGGDPNPWKLIAQKYDVVDHVIFDGTLESGQPVFDWLDNLDIYIHPSRKEGLPRALLEAMSRGCPAIATKIAGIPELLDSEAMINVNDDVCLSNKIEKMLSDKSTMVLQAKKNFKISSYYSTDILSSKRDKFWSSFKDYALQGS